MHQQQQVDTLLDTDCQFSSVWSAPNIQIRSRDLARSKNFELKLAYFFLYGEFFDQVDDFKAGRNVISAVSNVTIFKGKTCYNKTLVQEDWILVGKPVYFQNIRDISKLPRVVLSRLMFHIFSVYELSKITLGKKCAHFFLKDFLRFCRAVRSRDLIYIMFVGCEV